MIWDGASEISPPIGEKIEIDGYTFVVRSGDGLTAAQMCGRCALPKDLCARFNCVGSLRRDETKAYMEIEGR
ncbi:MAG: hypothetical protein IJU03_08105 [Thermoguttaceae bacterium]|nr:hypothetical protein [Thermoguttaceae bacterium]